MRNNLRNIFLLNSLLLVQMWFPINLNREAEYSIKENTCRKLSLHDTSCNQIIEPAVSSTTKAPEFSLDIITALSILTIAVAAACFLPSNNSKTCHYNFTFSIFQVYNAIVKHAYKIRLIVVLQFISLKKYFHTIYFHIFKSYIRFNLFS